MTRTRILATDPTAAEGVARLRNAAEVEMRLSPSREELIQWVRTADARLARSTTRVSVEIAGRLPAVIPDGAAAARADRSLRAWRIRRRPGRREDP